MRRIFLRFLWLTAVGMLLLGLHVPAAQAAALSLSIARSSDAADILITSRIVNEKYTLYIPGAWDSTHLTVTLAGAEEIKVGDFAIHSGDVVDFSPWLGSTQPLRNHKGGRIGTLTVYQGSRLPSVFISVDKKELAAVNKSKNNVITSGSLTFVEADGAVSYNGMLRSFHGRGNSTFAYSKKPYQFKLPIKAALGGMPKGKTWLLIANHLDLSLLRNQITLDLCREMGLPYALHSRQVDVYLNGEYNGLYLLTEKVQIGPTRIDIEDLEDATQDANLPDVSTFPKFNEKRSDLPYFRGYEIPDDPADITGGYILEMEKSYRFRDNITNGFRTAGGLSFTIKEPTYASRKQVDYIGTLVNSLHEALMASDGIDPATGVHYADRIDRISFARKYLIEELTKNYDFQASSQFFFKNADRVDPLIYAGPCWDYDLALGNIGMGNQKRLLPTGDYVNKTKRKDNLWYLLSNHDDFNAVLQEECIHTLLPALQILTGERPAPEGSVLRSMDDYAAEIASSAEMNFSRWRIANIKGYETSSGKTHDASVAFVKRYITKRAAYLLERWGSE